ncbi:MAG: envelope stress response membrane protein PspB [Sphingomonas sp.]|uniref:envelope stress response membrane protein PspB n=1 Tax=Sphingomonas sp. TaxID=28214 RepID=UPI0025FF5F29|nr:envelope stress response membrane protein PspB [Sphingomonas sp.]MBX3564993.1 envelope stress response membrane protein PspB [Sphingomonas sp.]
MEDIFIPLIAIGCIFIGLPWLIFHYVTKWKTIGSITGEDEKLLDELHYVARQLEERLLTVERIIAADNPDFRPLRPERSETEYDLSRRN